MDTENIFFFFLSIMTLAYAIKTSITMFLDRNKIAETQGKIVNIELVFPEIMMNRNVKLATFEYYVDGKRYISENQLKMSLAADVGDIKSIKYYIDKPSVLYTKSYIHFYLPLIVSFVCFLLGLISY